MIFIPGQQLTPQAYLVSFLLLRRASILCSARLEEHFQQSPVLLLTPNLRLHRLQDCGKERSNV